MKRKTIAIACGVLVAALLAAFWMKRHDPSPIQNLATTPNPVPSQDARLVELFGGEEGLKTVAYPTKVEAYRLKPDPQKQPREYAVTVGPVPLSKDLATKVSRDLVTSSSYWWEMGKPCKPRYGLRLSFHRGQDQVDVFLCYECMELLVARNGKMTSGLGQAKSFDFMNGRLVLAAKTLFPDDPEIQKLQPIDYELPE